MVEPALQLLREQGFSGDRSRVLIVGDRFDTDIMAGTLAGLRTCLVESGCRAAGGKVAAGPVGGPRPDPPRLVAPKARRWLLASPDRLPTGPWS